MNRPNSNKNDYFELQNGMSVKVCYSAARFMIYFSKSVYSSANRIEVQPGGIGIPDGKVDNIVKLSLDGESIYKIRVRFASKKEMDDFKHFCDSH